MTGSGRRALHVLEDERRMLIEECERTKLSLGELKGGRRPRYRRGDARGSANRAALVETLTGKNEQLRALNREIKAERRRLSSLLVEGSPRPRTAFQYMVALYRLLDVAVPRDQRTQEERALMRRVRDFVMTGLATND